MFCHGFRLFLLDPVAGAVDQMAAAHIGAGAFLHLFQPAGALPYAPILRPRDEAGRYVDRAAGIEFQFGAVFRFRATAVPVETALEAGTVELAAIYLQLALRQPATPFDLRCRRHFLRDGLGHVMVEIHNIIGRHLLQF